MELQPLSSGDIRLHDERFPNGCMEIRQSVLGAVKFESRAEFACAALLEKYVAPWVCQRGTTYQVPIGFNRACDFKVQDVFVEYHVVVFNREFDDNIAYRKFDNAIRKVSPYWRHQIKEAIFAEFLERYYRKRKFCIEANPDTRGSELVLAHSPQSFYHSVIRRFSDKPPALKEFVKEFSLLQRAGDGSEAHQIDKL